MLSEMAPLIWLNYFLALEQKLIAGADPNMKDFWRQTPLSMAKDLSGKNPIHMPDIWTPELIENSTAVVKLLLDAGADEKESWALLSG